MVKKSSKTIKDYEAMTLADIRAEAQEIKLENFMELPNEN